MPPKLFRPPIPVLQSLMSPIGQILFNKRLADITSFDPQVLHIFSRQVLDMIRAGEAGWEDMVPPYVDNMIKDNRLFGYQPKATPAST